MPTILRGDARNLPLPDASVDLICTSPPYFGLRSYQDGGEHYAGQVGAEATPAEFIAALIDCTREMVRVLKPSGSIFLNLGDKYANSPPSKTSETVTGLSGGKSFRASRGRERLAFGVPTKSLCLLPERYRIAAVDELGLIARAVIVWSKPNGLPESVTDRVRRSHEDWVHLTKAPRYYASVDEIREPTNIGNRPVASWAERKAAGNITHAPENGHSTGVGMAPNPLGKRPGSVWTIATQPLRVPPELGIDHFAAFPMEWPRRLIQGWCPREVCTVCGEGRRPVMAAAPFTPKGWAVGQQEDDGRGWHGGDPATRSLGIPASARQRTITGYACACPDTSAQSTPGVVLDPFGGTGTTALVATMLGRQGISVDLSADYCRLAEWRANDPKERARAAGLDPNVVAKVHHQLPGQESLLDLLGDAS